MATLPVRRRGRTGAVVLHAAAAVVALLAATVLSVFEPWGRTGIASERAVPWATVGVIVGVALILAIVVGLHLAGVAPHR